MSFEAASVKPAKPDGDFNPAFRRGTLARLEYRNYPLVSLVAEAYGLAVYQVQGPTWLARERYDIIAKRTSGSNAAQTRLMMQSLLKDRFHLAAHHATKVMPVYHLLPGKTVALLRPEHDEPDVPGCKSFGTLTEFADLLANRLNSPVIDKTEIPGTFYFILAFSQNLNANEPGRGVAPLPPAPPSPPPCPGWSAKTMPPLASSLFEAVKVQMGLKLEKRAPEAVDVLVVDRADKTPESN